MKYVKVGVALLAVVWLYNLFAPAWTAQGAIKQKVTEGTRVTSNIAASKTGKVMAAMNAFFATVGDVDTVRYRDTVVAQGRVGRAIREGYQEAVDELDGTRSASSAPRNIIYPQINALQGPILIAGPTRVTFEGDVWSPNERHTGPDGTDETALGKDNAAPTLPHNSVVYAWCRTCPAKFAGKGRIFGCTEDDRGQLWVRVNSWNVRQGIPTSADTEEQQGGFTYSVEKVMTAACKG